MSPHLTIPKIIENFQKQIPFEGYTEDKSLYIKVEEFVPYICLALHNGHNLRKPLLQQSALTQKERFYEEDPHTGDFISSLPIVIIAQDSRYEYDLNRSPKECIYEKAWGKKAWKTPLDNKQKNISLQKHKIFYTLFTALVNTLIENYASCIVFDIHSYNYKRIKGANLPVFNLGTAFINQKKYGELANQWLKELNKIKLPHVSVSTAKDDVFLGKGYLAQYSTKTWANVLVLPTEIKKIYIDEEVGSSFPFVIDELKKGIKKAIVNTAIKFSKKNTIIQKPSKNQMLSSTLDKEVIKFDNLFYQICKGINILNFVNPVNLNQEKKLFFKKRFSENPDFRYKQLIVRPYDFKEKIYRLPVDKISDISIQTMYRETINAFADKIELLAHVGKPKFLYNSLRYYGEPSTTDISNAKFLLHALDEVKEDSILSPQEAKSLFLEAEEEYGIKLKVELSNRLVARAMFNPGTRTLIINKNCTFSSFEVKALISHELGVHMLTTENALLQPLKIFRVGLPVNTFTQEGLAVLSEYLSGCLSLERLKVLALRVIAVSMLLEGYDFRKTFLFLVEEYELDKDEAFSLTTRVFRGGGFTKDFLYLRGFRRAITLYNKNSNLSSLFIGKTSFKLKTITDELLERKIIPQPKYIPVAFKNPKKSDPVLSYIVQSIH